MLYAPLDLFGVATVGGVGAGQAHTVYRAAQKAGKAKADKLPTTGAIRHWLDDSRPSRAPQGHAGLAG